MSKRELCRLPECVIFVKESKDYNGKEICGHGFMVGIGTLIRVFDTSIYLTVKKEPGVWNYPYPMTFQYRSNSAVFCGKPLKPT